MFTTKRNRKPLRAGRKEIFFPLFCIIFKKKITYGRCLLLTPWWKESPFSGDLRLSGGLITCTLGSEVFRLIRKWSKLIQFTTILYIDILGRPLLLLLARCIQEKGPPTLSSISCQSESDTCCSSPATLYDIVSLKMAQSFSSQQVFAAFLTQQLVFCHSKASITLAVGSFLLSGHLGFVRIFF